jgi:hypothetical protein
LVLVPVGGVTSTVGDVSEGEDEIVPESRMESGADTDPARFALALVSVTSDVEDGCETTSVSVPVSVPVSSDGTGAVAGACRAKGAEVAVRRETGLDVEGGGDEADHGEGEMFPLVSAVAPADLAREDGSVDVDIGGPFTSFCTSS